LQIVHIPSLSPELESVRKYAHIVFIHFI
jgi:hypothetical protein